jgi:hypothetical protein
MNQHSSLQKYLQGIHEQKTVEEEPDLVFLFAEENMEADMRKEQCAQKKVERKAVPFNSTVDRVIKERPKTSVGPGSYNIEEMKSAQQLNRQSLRREGNYPLAKFVKISAAEDRIIKQEPNL